MQNQPQGLAHIRHGASLAHVRLHLDNKRLTRKRSKAENAYYLGDSAFSREEYKAFRSGVPQPIAELCKVNDINFQSQHDAPYWLSLNANEVSRQLNSIIDLGIIDDVLKNAAQSVRQAEAEVKAADKLLSEAAAEVKELAWVEKCARAWAGIEQQRRLVDAGATKCGLLRDRLGLAIDTRDKAKQARSMATQARAVVAKGRDLGSLWNKTQALNRAMDNAEDIGRQCNALRIQADKAKKELDEALEGGCPICGRPMPVNQ